MQKCGTSAYHPNGNGGVGLANNTMTEMLEMTFNELQNHSDVPLPHVQFSGINSVRAAAGLAREVYMNGVSGLPLSTFDHHYA